MSDGIHELLAALKFYANDKNWEVFCDGRITGSPAWSHAGNDGGEKAKQALSAWRQRKSTKAVSA